jgi:Uma2 family endonuclease
MATTTHVPVVLESGDRLTRAEFHARYCQRPDIRKAELVGGIVFVASPVRSEFHGEPLALVALWAGAYAARRPGVAVAIDSTVFLGDDTEVQPDVAIFRAPGVGTPIRRTDTGYLDGPPDLIVEVAASSASYDLHDKYAAYQRAGVPEYVVWRVLDGALDWFRLRDGAYVRVEPDAGGLIESAVLPGLRLRPSALLAGDRAVILADLERPPAEPA